MVPCRCYRFSSVKVDYHGSMSFFMGFQGSRLGFHGLCGFLGLFIIYGSRSFFFQFQVGFQGSRLVIHGFRWFSLIFMVLGWFFGDPGWFFMVPGAFYGYSWLWVGFDGSGSVFMCFQGSRLVFHGSR